MGNLLLNRVSQYLSRKSTITQSFKNREIFDTGVKEEKLDIGVERKNDQRVNDENEKGVDFLSKKYTTSIFMLAILSFGFFLRIHDLSFLSLWRDEPRYVELSKHSLDYIIKALKLQLVYPPLYHFFLHFWMKLFGSSEFVLRLPSVLFGVSSISILFILVKNVINKRIALISSFLLSISPLHIWYSRNVSSYATLTFFMLLSAYFFLRALRDDQWRDWFAYAVSMLIGMYIHYSTLFFLVVILGVNIWQSWKTKSIASKAVRINGFIFLFFLPGLWLFSHNIFNLAEVIPGRDFSLKDIKLVVESGTRVFVHFILGDDYSMWGVHRVLTIQATVLFFNAFVSKLGHRKAIGLFAGWVFVPFALEMAADFMGVTGGRARHILFAVPFLFVLLSIGLMSFRSRASKVINSLLLVGIMMLPIVSKTLPYDQREDWRSAVDYINQNVRNGDVVGFLNPWIFSHFQYYNKTNVNFFGMTTDSTFTNRELLAASIGDAVTSENLGGIISRIQRKVRPYKRLWIIENRGSNDRKRLIRNWLDNHYVRLLYRESSMDGGQVPVSLYEIK